MTHIPFFCFCLTAGLAVSSSLRTLDKRPNCNQQVRGSGVDNCKISECSDKHTVEQQQVPTGPEWDAEHMGVWMDRHGLVPVINVTWKIKADAGISKLLGSEINILDESTNQSMCLQFSYSLSTQLNPNHERWKFSLYGVEVVPGHTYTVTVFNLPEPETRHYRIRKQITIPRCDNKSIQQAQMCLENDYPPQTAFIKATVGLLAIGACLAYLLWRASRKGLHSYYKLLPLSDPVNTSSSAAKDQPEGFQVQERRRVLIIYSLDHPLYKNIVLKLCAFLATKCGTEVVLDLLDSTRLGVLGSIQWLDWHREQIERSSDKILILCSRGVQAKWRALCGERKVFLREDVRSPVSDMLSPALSLMVPHFIRSASFEKYIVAYFDDVCSEDDVPSPFNITVRYKLMKHFEELVFRILDTEKHEPGRVNHIEGLSEDEYHLCPPGRALRDAIEAFHAYQMEHPQWFEEELLESSELEAEEAEETSDEICDGAYCAQDSPQVIDHVETQESDFAETIPEYFRAQRSVVDACGLCKHSLGQSSAFWAKFLDFLCHRRSSSCFQGFPQNLNRMRMLKRASELILKRGITTYDNRLCKNDSLFRVHPSVSQALAENKPVVALESTIITHGMPYPHNLSTAKEVEAIVRAEGATPATVGVIEGEVHIGLSSEELDHLASCRNSLKVSRRDLPYIISNKLTGGTTVSATMIAAHRAGIHVFVTGGIGGVHRGGEKSLDISADLTELGRTPIAVVSAGVKSILDIGRTLEYLETQGVCVATYGALKNFPAFFSPQSGFTSPYQVCNPDEAAKLIASTLSLGLQSGILLAVPIPEEHAAAGQQIEEAIQAAVTEASAKGITGRDVTPFILQKVSEVTKGKSLQSNIALIHNNAKVGSQIACALSKQRNERKLNGKTRHQEKHSAESDIVNINMCDEFIILLTQHSTQKAIVLQVVIGGINVDFIAKGKTKTLHFGQTNPGSVCQTFGGVGRNIADSLSRLDCRPLFISATGADSHSDAVLNYCKHMNTSGVAQLQEQSTATYCAVITESGELSLGLGDMDIHQQITEQYVSQFEKQLSSATLVCLDGNIPVSTIDYVCSIASKHNINIWYEPTDSEKACKPFLSDAWKSLSYSSPNLAELCTMNKTLGISTPEELPSSLEEVLSVAVTLSRPLLEQLHCVVVTLGAKGVLVCGEHDAGSVNLQPRKERRRRQLCALHYPALTVTAEETMNVSGAGDSLAGALMAGISQRRDTDSCVRMGLLAARLSLASPHPIAPTLTLDSVDPSKVQHWPKPSFRRIE
ncbi:hypothetical protein L3Q82_023783 [Scortum barcoo]|uniref:Uncharacterized protein n=1 Tax=Scortum barcoo TaxID=214431 RepID=A0ACB8WTV4_9TELE|nr:hypothetical protein L3Q82_023783 [Scortum barcoo]